MRSSSAGNPALWAGLPHSSAGAYPPAALPRSRLGKEKLSVWRPAKESLRDELARTHHSARPARLRRAALLRSRTRPDRGRERRRAVAVVVHGRAIARRHVERDRATPRP